MKRPRRLAGRAAPIAVALLVAAGCGAASSPGNAAATASVASMALATPSSTPPRMPTPVPTPTPRATGPILVWRTVFSSDGTAAEAAKLKGGISAAVAVGDGFVLAGSEEKTQGAVVWYSPDGSSWQAIDSVPGFADGVIRLLVAMPTGLLAEGTAQKLDSECAGGALGCNPVSSIRLWISPDGREWHALPDRSTAPFGRAQLDLIVSGRAGLVAFGELVPATGTNIAALVWTSPDGESWTPAPQFSTAYPTDTMLDLEAGPDGYVAVGSRWVGGNVSGPRRAWYSSDGKTWKLGSGPATTGPTLVMACAAGFFGVDNPAALASFWTSADGVRWMVQPSVVDHPGYPTYVGSGLFSDGRRILAFGMDAYQTKGAWISTDGRNWQSVQQSGSQPPLDTADSGSVVGAFGANGVLVTTAVDAAPGVTTWTLWLGTISS